MGEIKKTLGVQQLAQHLFHSLVKKDSALDNVFQPGKGRTQMYLAHNEVSIAAFLLHGIEVTREYGGFAAFAQDFKTAGCGKQSAGIKGAIAVQKRNMEIEQPVQALYTGKESHMKRRFRQCLRTE